MLKVDEIIDHSGAAPRIETTLRPTPQSVEELTKIYYEIYVPGLCQFFESQWFNFQSQGHNSISIFLHNDPLISLLGSFLVSLHTVNADPNHFSYCGHLETRVVWALAKLAYTVPSGVNMPRDDPLPENNPSETRVSIPRRCVSFQPTPDLPTAAPFQDSTLYPMFQQLTMNVAESCPCL